MRWEGDKGGKAPARQCGPLDADREARVLRDWADGWSCTDIAARFGNGMTRNTPMGIVHRSRGEAAEGAKRARRGGGCHIRYPKAAPRASKRAHTEAVRRAG